MNKWALLLICLLAIALCSPVSCSKTLTFDDVASGTRLRSSLLYHETYRVTFDDRFRATDHTASPWGLPNSSPNVLTLPTDVQYGPGIMMFGYFMPSYGDYDYLASVGAYFSTQSNVQVRVTAYYVVLGHPGVEVTSVVIGAPGESWNNRYVEIASPGSSFSELQFEGVNSPSDLLGFCADDMTITYVPEPSSLLALAGGVGVLGTVVRRRKR